MNGGSFLPVRYAELGNTEAARNALGSVHAGSRSISAIERPSIRSSRIGAFESLNYDTRCYMIARELVNLFSLDFLIDERRFT